MEQKEVMALVTEKVYATLITYCRINHKRRFHSKEHMLEVIHNAILNAVRLYDPDKSSICHYIQQWIKWRLVLPQLKETLMEDLPDAPVIEVDELEENEFVEWLLTSLLDHERRAILYEVNGLSREEIGHKIGLARTSANRVVFNAIHKMRAKLESNAGMFPTPKRKVRRGRKFER